MRGQPAHPSPCLSAFAPGLAHRSEPQRTSRRGRGPLRCADLTFDALGGLLLGLTVISKGHFLYMWYIVLIFAVPQTLADLWVLISTYLGIFGIIGRRRKF